MQGGPFLTAEFGDGGSVMHVAQLPLSIVIKLLAVAVGAHLVHPGGELLADVVER